MVDITNPQQITEVVRRYKIDTIFNLAALLSAVAEAKPQLAWQIGLGGLFNVPRGSTREWLCGLHPQLYRLLRSRDTARHDATGHHPAPQDHVWGDEGLWRTPQ